MGRYANETDCRIGVKPTYGVEITHKVNAEELITLLSEIRIQAPASNQHQTSSEIWSIYLYQNGYMHIMLGESDIIAMVARETSTYSIAGGSDIEYALLRMIE